MTSSGERAAYWRVPGLALEAMGARFEHYAYPMHAHDTYSFGVTDDGAQSFVCRGERHVSAAGLVMTFNPDEPHDGQSAVHHGYRYRMLHIGEDLVREVLADAAPGTAGLPLFDTPVVDNPALARTVTRLHTSVVEHAPRLVVEECLTAAVLALSRDAATRPARLPDPQGRVDLAAMARARSLLRQRFADNIGADELARVAGCSRFTLYRGFRAAYGLHRATTSAICGCAEPARSWLRAWRRRRRPPRPASRTRPTSPGGSPAPTESPQPHTHGATQRERAVAERSGEVPVIGASPQDPVICLVGRVS